LIEKRECHHKASYQKDPWIPQCKPHVNISTVKIQKIKFYQTNRRQQSITDGIKKHNCQSLLGFDQSTYSLGSLCNFQKKKQKKAPSKYSKKNKIGPIELVLRKKLVKREDTWIASSSNLQCQEKFHHQGSNLTGYFTENTHQQVNKNQICKALQTQQVKKMTAFKGLTEKQQRSCHCHKTHRAKNRNLHCAHHPSQQAH